MARGFVRFAAFLSIVLVALTGGLKAQDFEGKNISEVEIRFNGAKTVDEARIRNMMISKANTPYSTENLDLDVKALYESGLVEDVRFLAEQEGDNVRLIADLTTRDEYVSIDFKGNARFNKEKLAEETKLKSRGVLTDEVILEARRNLEKYYQGYGYPDVRVTHLVQPTEQVGKADLVFVIDEGVKNEVRKIRFEGNHAFTSRDLRKEMKVKPKGWFSWLTKSGRFEAEELDSDLDAVLDYYRSRGYLRVSGEIKREPVGDGRVDLVVSINEGEKYTVASVGFGTMTVFKSEELYPELTLVANKAYSSKKMRRDIIQIRSLYGARGYADAMVSPDIRDAGPNRVGITYRVTEGKRFHVGKVNIQGNTKTKDKVIRRESTLKPGDWFNSVELDVTRDRLKGLQYFKDVQVSGSPAGNGYRDVDVLVEEGPTGSVSVGFAFGSIDSIMGIIRYEQSNFDLFNRWSFTGGGQRFLINLNAGTQRSDFTMSLVEPWFLDRQLKLGGEVFYHSYENLSDYYDQTNVGGAVFLVRPINNFSQLKLEYRLEQVAIDVFSSTPPLSELVTEHQDGDYMRSAVALNYVFDNRDDAIVPRSGHKVDVGLTLAGTLLGGDVDAVTFSAKGQKYWNLRWDSILSISGELASADSTDGGDLPIFERMFLGGPHTLRGFEFRDVGPRDRPNTTGEVMGGNSLGYVSLEYTYPIMDAFRLAAFYDMGFVNGSSWDWSPNDLYGDVGLGVRLRLPFSPLPLAMDYAFPVMIPDKQADKGGQFNFYMKYEY